MNTSFSPGPWTAPPDKSFYVMGKLGGLIASCNSQANAQLIAAAPELLEQCVILCDAITQFSSGDEWPELKPAWSIISKATRQNP